MPDGTLGIIVEACHGINDFVSFFIKSRRYRHGDTRTVPALFPALIRAGLFGMTRFPQ